MTLTLPDLFPPIGAARYLIGDVFERLATLEDDSVDLILTSPPFLALRSYLPADHPDKAKEIGAEPTPAAFLDTLLALSAEWRRVLAPHGSLCVELGDTYAGDDRRNSETPDAKVAHRAEGRAGSSRANVGPGWPLAKSLCGIPHLYHLSLAYGRNLLTGQDSPAGQWRVRNVVAWCRPNPPVGALGDKFRPATSYMTVACVGGQRWFDLDAVRTEAPRTDNQRTTSTQYAAPGQPERKTRASTEDGSRIYANPGGAPPLDWWAIPTQPYKGAHYATWPEALCARPIEAMCPRRVCRTCGVPSSRIAETTNAVGKAVGRAAWDNGTEGIGAGHSGEIGVHANHPSVPDFAGRRTLGWTDCGHDDWRNGLVLDPFAGSGTTLAVAVGHGRDAIGIDLDARNAELAIGRCSGIGGTGAPNPLTVTP